MLERHSEPNDGGVHLVQAEAPTRVDFTGGFTDVPALSCGPSSLHVNAAIGLSVAARVSRSQMDASRTGGVTRETSV